MQQYLAVIQLFLGLKSRLFLAGEQQAVQVVQIGHWLQSCNRQKREGTLDRKFPT